MTGPQNTYLHDIQPDGALHAGHCATRAAGNLNALDEDAVRRASSDPDLRIARRANFVAFVSTDERKAEAAANYAEANAAWSGLRDYRGCEQEGAWLVGRPAELRTFGAPAVDLGATLRTC